MWRPVPTGTGTTVVLPGCGATRGLHAHHIWHWEDGGPTELWNLVLVCPFHHRLHHRGLITIRGPGDSVTVTDVSGRVLDGSSVARPPSKAPPAAPPYDGPHRRACRLALVHAVRTRTSQAERQLTIRRGRVGRCADTGSSVTHPELRLGGGLGVATAILATLITLR